MGSAGSALVAASTERLPTVSIDLLDFEVGARCNLCLEGGRAAEAIMRDPDIGPVCGDCMVEVLQSNRRLHDLAAAKGVTP